MLSTCRAYEHSHYIDLSLSLNQWCDKKLSKLLHRAAVSASSFDGKPAPELIDARKESDHMLLRETVPISVQ